MKDVAVMAMFALVVAAAMLTGIDFVAPAIGSYVGEIVVSSIISLFVI